MMTLSTLIHKLFHRGYTLVPARDSVGWSTMMFKCSMCGHTSMIIPTKYPGPM